MESADRSQGTPTANGLAGAQDWIVNALGWLIGFVGAGAVILEADRDGGSLRAMWAFLLVGWAPVIFVHEFGHAFAAQAAGWRVLVFHVAPYAWRTRPQGFSFAGSLDGPDVAGSVIACPPTERERTKLREVIFVIGGPTFSLLLALVLVSWSLWGWSAQGDIALIGMLRTAFDPTYTPVAASADMWRAIVFATGLYSLAGFVLSAWPQYGPEGPRNDAAILAYTLTMGVGPAPEAAVDHAQMMWRLGIPPHHWPEWVHAGLNTLRRDTELAPATYGIDTLVALDANAIDDVRSKVVHMREIYPDSIDIVTADAFVAACVDGDFEAAKNRLVERSDLNEAQWWFTPYFWQLAHAAVAANAGDLAMRDARLEAVSRASLAQPFTHGFWLKQIARAKHAVLTPATQRDV